MKKLLVSVVSVLIPAVFVLAQGVVLPFDPAVRTGKLSNGLTYFIRHNEEPKNRVIFYLANKVGSILEDDDQQGLAHFVEHMSFNGTKHYPKNELVNYLQKSGVRFGADLNAYTGFDETVYQLPLPSNDTAILSHGMQIMRDWAQEATLDAGEIDKERGVILEEKRLRKGAGQRMQQQYLPQVLNHSRYSVRQPIGVDSILERFRPETLRKFYHDWYRPDLQALIVVGDIDVDAMEKAIKVRFGDLRNPAGEKARVQYTTPLTGKNQFITVTDPEQTQTALQVMMKQPALSLHTAAEYRASMVRGLFNDMISARYTELSRKENPAFLQGGAGVSNFISGVDNYGVSVVAKPGELENGFKTIWRETERAKLYGFTSTELERAKKNILSGLEATYREKDKTNSDSYVNEYLQYFLHGTVAPGIEYEYKVAKKDLSEITVDEVNQVGKTGLSDRDRDIVIMASEKDRASLPDEATVLGWIKAVRAESLSAYTDNVSALPLLSAQPVPGRIVSEAPDTLLHTTRLTLSNGVVILLKPTTFKVDEIQFTGFSAGGSSLYGDEDFVSANEAAGIISASGVGNYTPDQMTKFLTGKRLGVGPNIGERMQGISGGGDPKDLETMLQIVYAYFTEPRKDPAIFKSIITRSKAGLKNRQDDPNSVFSDSVSAILYNNNIRRTGPSVRKLDQIDLERVYSVFRERFADASGWVFTFVGNIDLDSIRPLLAKYLGSLPATHKGEHARDLHIRMPEGKREITIHKGTEPKASVQIIWNGAYKYGQVSNLEMDALKECVQLRLLERLREDESGVYTPSAFVNFSKFPENRYVFGVSFGCAPENVEKLIAATFDEIGKIKKDGPPQANVDKWRTALQRGYETSVMTNSFWLGYLNAKLQNEDDIHGLSSYNSDLLSILPEAVKRAANRYLPDNDYKRLVLLPEAGAKKQQ